MRQDSKGFFLSKIICCPFVFPLTRVTLCLGADATVEDIEALHEDLKSVHNASVAQARKRSKHLRPEQLSQGVLVQLLRMLGRATVAQVRKCLFRPFRMLAHGTLLVCQAPCVVIDPFCGTGSTGAAALLLRVLLQVELL